MKPNDIQKETISRIIGIVKGWETTNDINSPSHHTLIEEDLSDLDLLPSDIANLTQTLDELWWIVQCFNHEHFSIPDNEHL